jgi:SanA protein
VKKIKMNKKRWCFLVILLLGPALLWLVSHALIYSAAEGKVYEDVNALPKRSVALILGTSRYLKNGQDNLYFRYRIQAGADLYKNKKADYLIVSGDNSRPEYDEATDMKEALMELGVPGEIIFMDFAGFRTLDSVVRADHIFGQKKFTIVSQPDHLARAIYLGQSHDLDVIGYAARAVGGLRSRSQLREGLARVKAVLDVTLLGKEPKFYGPMVPIPSS